MLNKQELYDYLASLPNVVPKEDGWLATRCVICGDSKKNPYKKRMYINCDPTMPEEPVWYHCFNCNSCSVLTKDLLEKICDGQNEFTSGIDTLNKSSKAMSGTVKSTTRVQVEKPIPYIVPKFNIKDGNQIRKIQYLSDRIGVQMTPFDERLDHMKIVWSLKEFLQENQISMIPKSHVPYEVMECDYVGFLSVTNRCIIMRDITNTHEYRWYKYYLVKGGSGYYTGKTQVDFFTQDPIRIVVAEGPVDILSLFYNFYNQEIMNIIYIAVCNGAFETAIKYYLMKGIVGENVFIDCYLDNDTRYDYSKMQKDILPLLQNDASRMKFYRNIKKKDFGYPMKDIQREEVIVTKRMNLL